MEDKENKTEEIDLGGVFSIIEKVINRFFGFIGRILKAIFHYIILFILLVKKRIILISLFVLVGGVLGFLRDKFIPKTYAYEMVIAPKNTEVMSEVYKKINLYNSFTDNEKKKVLPEELNISEDEAISIKSFEIIPFESKIDKVNKFDDYRENIDTSIANNITLEEYLTYLDPKYDAVRYKIKFVSKQKQMTPFGDTFIEKIVSNPYLIKRRQDKLNVIKLDSTSTINASKAIDSVLFYNLSTAKNKKDDSDKILLNFSENSEIFKNEQSELFKIQSTFRTVYIGLERGKNRNKYILNAVTTFPVYGSIEGGANSVFKYGLYGLLCAITLLLLIEFNKILNNYNI